MIYNDKNAFRRIAMPFTLPVLPYAEDALDPIYSARTISFHYGKHHKAYVDNLNKLIAGTDWEIKTPELS